MVNPFIKKKMDSYQAEECCLSLTGFRNTIRYETIEVEYLDADFKNQKGTFTGYKMRIRLENI